MISEGYQSFGYIAGWEGRQLKEIERQDFALFLAEHGFELNFRAVGNFHSGQACKAAQRLVSQKDRPEAVFVANDAMALVVMDVLRHEAHLAVPDDIAVVGYDDIPHAA